MYAGLHISDRDLVAKSLRTLHGAYRAGTNADPADVARVAVIARSPRQITDDDRALLAVAAFTERERMRANNWDDRALTRLLGLLGWRD